MPLKCARCEVMHSDFKINIEDIPDEGLSFERTLDDAIVRDLLNQSGADFGLAEDAAAASFSLQLHKVDQTILVRGRISGRYYMPCRRCLKAAAIDVNDSSVQLTFLPGTSFSADGQEIELGEDDLDTYFHNGIELDMAELLRDQLVLAAPIAPLCDESCEGFKELSAENQNSETQEDIEIKSSWKAALSQIK